MTDHNESAPASVALPGTTASEAKYAGEANSEPEARPQGEQTANGRPGRPKTEFERRLGMVNTFVQILAIFLGGGFAIIKFGFLDAPALQKNLRINGSLDWTDRVGSSCIAETDIEATNLSKSKVEIKEVRGWAWLVEEQPRKEKAISYFNIKEDAMKTDPVEEFQYVDGPLVQSYATGQSAHHTFEWFVERKKDTYALFEIDVFDEMGAKVPLDHQSQWDLVCGPMPTKTPIGSEKKE